MTRSGSLEADYFDGIFKGDSDPWNLATSTYERAKHDRTLAVLDDRRYHAALEVGCAHGVLTGRLAALCDHLLAIDISAAALSLARNRLGVNPHVTLAQMAFPRQSPGGRFDLCLLSEVAYYWDRADLHEAGFWLCGHVSRGGRALMVHYTEETDYPSTADEAVAALQEATHGSFARCLSERHDRYRLDLWERL